MGMVSSRGTMVQARTELHLMHIIGSRVARGTSMGWDGLSYTCDAPAPGIV